MRCDTPDVDADFLRNLSQHALAAAEASLCGFGNPILTSFAYVSDEDIFGFPEEEFLHFVTLRCHRCCEGRLRTWRSCCGYAALAGAGQKSAAGYVPAAQFGSRGGNC